MANLTSTCSSIRAGGEGVPQDLPKAVKTLSEVLQFAEAKHTLGAW